MENLTTESNEDEILISLVQNRSLLYDKSSPHFKDNQKKKEAWLDIASKMYIITEEPTEVKVIRNRWKTLKKKYMDERRKFSEYTPSGSGASEVTSTWEYFTIMDFLKTYVQHRKTSSNFNLPGRENLHEGSDDGEDYEDSESEEQAEDSTEDDGFNDAPNESETSRKTCTTEATDVNNYLLIFRDAWNRIPDKNKRKCFFEAREVIRKRKKEMSESVNE